MINNETRSLLYDKTIDVFNISDHTISYIFRGRVFLISHWSNANYFVVAFLTLFFQDVGGYCNKKDYRISIETFVEWILSHHFRRFVKWLNFKQLNKINFNNFVKHHVFMFLIYDVIQIQKTFVGNSLLAKRKNWNKIQEKLRTLTSKDLRKVNVVVSNH